MPYITTADGAEIFYKDWGSGQPVLFSHGWPLNGDAWDVEMKLVADHGFRAIAHDRRGHGRSSQTWTGNDMDTYAADLAALVEALDLRDLILVGHSTGGGEVVRYAARHGGDRVAEDRHRGRRPADHGQVRRQPRGHPARGVRRHPRRRPRRPVRVLPGALGRLLRHQPRGLDDLPGAARPVLAPGHAGRPGRRLRLRQGVLRDRLHLRPAGAHRPGAAGARRRRPDRARSRPRPSSRSSWCRTRR